MIFLNFILIIMIYYCDLFFPSFRWVPHPEGDNTQYFAVDGDITNQAYPYNSEFYDERIDYFGPLFKIK